MITGDLDAELGRSLRELAEAGKLPEEAVLVPGGTWRPAPAGGPGSYATSLPFEIARLAGRTPEDVAALLASSLSAEPWIDSAQPSGEGYLTVIVTAHALACVAPQIVAAGTACARSEILRGTSAVIRAWPDPAAAAGWDQAWERQAEAMTGRLAEAAGAAAVFPSDGERAVPGARVRRSANSPVLAAVAYFGVSAVRYRLARTLPGRTAQLAQEASASHRGADHYSAVQLAHAEAASALRWAAELELDLVEPGEKLASALDSEAERELLGLLSWLPVRVAAAARRHRPDEVPRYLEAVAAAWETCRQAAPALPFGGATAPTDLSVSSARLLLADALRLALEAGLALAGITARDRI